MKKLSYVTMGTLALLLICAGTVWADQADPSTLQINGGAGDPNLISGGSFVVLQNSGGAGTIGSLVLFFSVPNVTSAGSGGISSLTSTIGTVGSISLAGILSATGCSDVYSCVGISANASNNFPNFSAAELLHNSITGTSFGIYQVTITGANLGAKGSITITGAFPRGTFVDAFGIDNTGKAFSTPFTEAGLTTTAPIPEPGTLTLFGSGFLGIAALIRRRLSALWL